MNAIDRFINLFVNNKEANQQLDRTSRVLSNVDKETRNVSASNRVMTEEVTKNGGAMAILNTVTGGLAQQFKDGYEAASLMTGGLKGLRGAIIATGIGALAVGLGLAATNYDKFKEFFKGGGINSEEMQTMSKESAQKEAKFIESLNNKRLTSIKNVIELMKSKGATQDQINNEELKYNKELENSIINRNKQIDKEIERIGERRLDTEKYTDTEKESLLEINKLTVKYKDTKDKINKLEEANLKTIKALGEVEKEVEERGFKSLAAKNKMDVFKETIKDREKGINLLKEEESQLSKQLELLQETSPFEKEASDLRLEKLNNEIRYSQVQTTIKTINIENIRLDKERGKTIQALRKEYDLILINYKEQAQQLKVDTATSRGGFFSNIVKEDIKSIQTLTSTLNDLKTKRNEILEVGTGRGQRGLTTQQQTELDGINTLIKANRDLLSTKVKNLEIEKEIRKGFDTFDQENLRNLTDLQHEYDKLGNVIFKFEEGKIRENGKWIDDRYNNSNQFESLIQNENSLYQKQIDIIQKNREISTASSNEKLIKIDSEEQRIRDLLSTETNLTVEQKAQLNAQLLDLEVEKNRVNQEQATTDYNFKKELALSQYDNEVNLARLALEEKQMLRDEELERERQYYGAVTGIANESANFLDAMAAHGGKSSQKFAEAALKIKKFAGVANVAISAQEEIRGIWANPALTALPDTGVTAKTALTAGAIVRAGLSTATILKQRLGASPASSNTSPGGAPQFNIVESNGTNQLSARIGQQQNQPVQAYVVGSAVATQMALDRNILNNSTFLSWIIFVVTLSGFII